MTHDYDHTAYYDSNSPIGVYRHSTFIWWDKVPARCPKDLPGESLYVVFSTDIDKPAVMITPNPDRHDSAMLVDEGTGTEIASGGRQAMWELFLSHVRML